MDQTGFSEILLLFLQGWTKFYEFAFGDLRAGADIIDRLCTLAGMGKKKRQSRFYRDRGYQKQKYGRKNYSHTKQFRRPITTDAENQMNQSYREAYTCMRSMLSTGNYL